MSRIVQISCLGKHGRFGNQLFQYSFARAYAEKFDAVLQTPLDWQGRMLFRLDDPPIVDAVPRLPETHLMKFWGEVNVDLHGYFQFQDCLNILSRKKVREWFSFKEELIDGIPRPLETPYTAFHIRRGDYVQSVAHYCLVHKNSYYKALKKFNLDHTTVFEYSDEEGNLSNWLDDFINLMRAEYLFRANSTYSWWAGVLGNGRVFSPVVEDKTGWEDVDFVAGNWPKICDPKNFSEGFGTDLYLPN